MKENRSKWAQKLTVSEEELTHLDKCVKAKLQDQPEMKKDELVEYIIEKLSPHCQEKAKHKKYKKYKKIN